MGTISKLSIVFSTWGNPKSYKLVKYNFENSDKQYEEKSPIFVIIKEKNIPKSNICIFVPSTLISNEDIKDIKTNASIDKINEKIIERLSNYVNKDYLKVIPGIGDYKIGDFYLKLEYDSLIIYNQIYYEIVNFIKSKLNENYEDIEIILDQSNGLNFYNTLIYRILKEITMILAYKYNVSFYVYNCAPVTKGIQTSTIYTIEHIQHVEKYPIIDYMTSGPEKYRKKINGFIFSIKNCIPLLFIHLYNKINKKVDKLINEFQEKILKYEIMFNKNTIIIKNHANDLQDFATLLKLSLLKMIMKPLIPEPNNISIEDLYKHKCSLEYNRIFEYLIEYEIESLLKEVNNSKGSHEELNELIKKIDNEKIKTFLKNNKSKPSKIELRHFRAHMGFEFHSIKLEKKNDNMIIINYRNNVVDEVVNKIKNVIGP